MDSSEKQTKSKIEFTIKNKPIHFKIWVSFTVLSVGLAFMIALILVACKIDGYLWLLELVPACSFALSCMGLYKFYKEEFSYKYGEFRLVRLFKDEVKFWSDSIACVYFRRFGNFTKIEFVNKRGNIVLTIADDGTILQDDRFENALKALKISIERKGYDK